MHTFNVAYGEAIFREESEPSRDGMGLSLPGGDCVRSIPHRRRGPKVTTSVSIQRRLARVSVAASGCPTTCETIAGGDANTDESAALRGLRSSFGVFASRSRAGVH